MTTELQRPGGVPGLAEFLHKIQEIQDIAVNSLNTKRTSSLEKSLNEKYVHIPGYIRKVGPFIY